jgi:Cu(I)/Ag(I) efflux system membrane fusion protein
MKKLFHSPVTFTAFGFLLAGIFLITRASKSKTVPTSDIGKAVTCPVTGERFKITKDTRFVDYQGKRYYFCCPGCDKKFMENPQKYLESKPSRSEDSIMSETDSTKNEVSYWTCSMHPSVHSDKPGKCPICGMELIPIYKKSEGRIMLPEEKKLVLNIKSEPAEKRLLVKKIRVPASVVKDDELYLAEQELISARSGSAELLNSTRLKLKLLGFSNEAIAELLRQDNPDQSLILPTRQRAWVIGVIRELDLPLVKPNMKVRIFFDAYPGKAFWGTIMAVEPKINPLTRSAQARVLLKKTVVDLNSGMVGDMLLEIPLGKRLSIPISALINTGKRTIVYVEEKVGLYQPRPVVAGMETDEYVEILDGLEEGETVVTEGNFLLDSQTTLTGGQALLYGAAEAVKKEEPKPETHHH